MIDHKQSYKFSMHKHPSFIYVITNCLVLLA